MKSEMKRWRDEKKIFWGLNMYQAKSGVKNFGGGGGPKKLHPRQQPDIQTHRHHRD